jgi:hypothetical protein
MMMETRRPRRSMKKYGGMAERAHCVKATPASMVATSGLYPRYVWRM